MAKYSPYAQSSSLYQLGKTVKPLNTVDFNDDDSFLDWFKRAMDALRDEHRERTERDMLIRDFYMGMQSMYVGREGIPRDREGKPLDKFARVTINQCYELTEQWVSKMTRYAPAITVIPPNDEYNDRIAARLSKDFIDYLFYVNDFDDLLEEVARTTRIDGEVFMFVEWDKHTGDEHPDAKLAANYGIRVPLVDPVTQEPVLGEDNEPIFIQERKRVGDVKYEIKQRRFVICQPKSKWSDVEWVIKISAKDIDELKAEYPEKADELEMDASGSDALNLFTADAQWNEVLVYELYAKSTRFLSEGRYIKYTDKVVLENKTLKEKCGHEELPCVRLTNIDIPGMLHGYSFLEQILLLQVMYNNLASITYTNMALGSHIYWMVPAQGNVDISKLRNGASVIKHNAGMAPQIAQFRTAGPELFQALEFVGNQILLMSGNQGISRGEVPVGIEAGVALSFLEEQENQRANTDIKKHNSFIKKVARLSLATAGAFYDPSDGRTIRIVGKNNQFSIKALDVAKLGGPYDIRVQRTTALSESKSGRLSQILALAGRFPDILPKEQILDMLDLSNDQQFYDMGTVAVQAASRENELMAEGEEAMPPEVFEEHLVHWYQHGKYMQSASYKEDMPEDRKIMFKEHQMGHEYFMWEKAKTNPTFQQKLLMLENFPMFLAPPPVAPPPMPVQAQGEPAPGPAGAGEAPPPGEDVQAEPMDTGEPAGVPAPAPVEGEMKDEIPIG